MTWDTFKNDPAVYTIILKADKSEISRLGVVEERLTWPAGNKVNNFKD